MSLIERLKKPSTPEQASKDRVKAEYKALVNNVGTKVTEYSREVSGSFFPGSILRSFVNTRQRILDDRAQAIVNLNEADMQYRVLIEIGRSQKSELNTDNGCTVTASVGGLPVRVMVEDPYRKEALAGWGTRVKGNIRYFVEGDEVQAIDKVDIYPSGIEVLRADHDFIRSKKKVDEKTRLALEFLKTLAIRGCDVPSMSPSSKSDAASFIWSQSLLPDAGRKKRKDR